jgi:hypothetical protein
MKKEFKVSAIRTETNSKTNEKFVSIDMFIEKQINTNGCVKNVKMYASYNCISTTLVEGSTFEFDDATHYIKAYTYVNKESIEKTGHRILDII